MSQLSQKPTFHADRRMARFTSAGSSAEPETGKALIHINAG
jgi:hypothetical protein